MWGRAGKQFGSTIIVALCVAAPALEADDGRIATRSNSYGYPGMIDMPVATSQPDGELSFTISSFAGLTHNTVTFQLLPRLSGSFRYSIQENYRFLGRTITRYDRSFSLHYRLLDETYLRPAVAVGLNDFLGNGIHASEYVVATKTVGTRLRFSVGMGWGRLGSSNGFTNPLGIIDNRFETRPRRNYGLGGDVASAQWFRGDAALFGGVEWQATKRLRLTAEYSSDAYLNETPSAFNSRSQLNFGATYKLLPGVDLSLRYLYGSELGVQITSTLNPKNRPNHGGHDTAPPPVLARPALSDAALTWNGKIEQRVGLRARVADELEAQGVRLHGFAIDGGRARIEIENTAYYQTAQAVGRTARVLSRLLPVQVARFDITLVISGVPVTELRIDRDDIETLEHDLEGSWKSFARTRFSSPAGTPNPLPGHYPRFEWGVKPYLSPSLFDPDAPVRADIGAQFDLSYQPAPGLEFSGSLRKKVLGNLDTATRVSDSVLPHVRSDFNLYDKHGDPSITHLTGAYYFKPGRDLYGRVTLGYLERMYGGLSSELLWKRNDSPFALGIELNHVWQRDFDQRFGFRNYEVTTGHVSAYWDMGKGFHAQLDAGRYLARDWGATFSLDREFKNGWKIGAFATLTDVPFSEFGEGSFDKGIRVTVPISWLTGKPNKTAVSTTFRPLTRDGGARLDVNGRLYERVRPLHKPALRDGWGRFWR